MEIDTEHPGVDSGVAKIGRDGFLVFWCPGCDCAHQVPTKPDPRGWQFNGDLKSPTLSPSILVTHNGPNSDLPGEPPSRCHSFVKDGKIQFLADCSHALKGTTVSLPPWPPKGDCYV